MNKENAAPQIQSELSIERTKLANHRTLLSYLRSAAALVVAGAGLLKFIQVQAWIIIGWGFIGLAPLLLVIGFVEYFRVNKLIKKEEACMNQYVVNSDPDED